MNMSKTNYPIVPITWEEVVAYTKHIAKRIREDKIQIDVIVPILKGGMPTAMLLGSMLEISDFSCLHIRRSLSDNPNSDFGEAVNKGVTNASAIKGANILLVDDILDTKKTLDYAIEVIRKYQPKKIYVAILLHKKNALSQSQ